MNPFRLFNPLYVLRLERKMVGLILKSSGLTSRVDLELAARREYLKRIADLMASGRVRQAKALIDVLVSAIEDDAA